MTGSSAAASSMRCTQGLGRLYVIVHQGGPYGHKDAGQGRVGIRPRDTQRRRRNFELHDPATNLGVTKDAAPLLITDSEARPAVDVYDALKRRGAAHDRRDRRRRRASSRAHEHRPRHRR